MPDRHRLRPASSLPTPINAEQTQRRWKTGLFTGAADENTTGRGSDAAVLRSGRHRLVAEGEAARVDLTPTLKGPQGDLGCQVVRR